MVLCKKKLFYGLGQLLVAGGAAAGRDRGRRDGGPQLRRLLIRGPGTQALRRCLQVQQ